MASPSGRGERGLQVPGGALRHASTMPKACGTRRPRYRGADGTSGRYGRRDACTTSVTPDLKRRRMSKPDGAELLFVALDGLAEGEGEFFGGKDAHVDAGVDVHGRACFGLGGVVGHGAEVEHDFFGLGTHGDAADVAIEVSGLFLAAGWTWTLLLSCAPGCWPMRGFTSDIAGLQSPINGGYQKIAG